MPDSDVIHVMEKSLLVLTMLVTGIVRVTQLESTPTGNRCQRNVIVSQREHQSGQVTFKDKDSIILGL